MQEDRIARVKKEQGQQVATPPQSTGSVPASTTPVSPATTSKPGAAPIAPAPSRTPEVVPKHPKILLAEAFASATSFPFEFGGDKVDFSADRLNIGNRQFSLNVSNGFISPPVSSIEFVGTDIKIGHLA